MSEEKTFNEKLVSLIAELKAPKGQWNDYGGYHYRSGEDILEAVKPLALKYGLLPTLSDEIVMIGERYYVKAVASITDGNSSHQALGYARESQVKKGMDESQITGTASSYARKYAMNGLYLIDDTKDTDTNEYKNQQEKGNQKKNQKKQNNQQEKLVNGQQLATLKDEARKISELAGNDPDDVLNKLNQMLNIQDTSQMEMKNFGGAMNVLKKWHKNYEKKVGQTA